MRSRKKHQTKKAMLMFHGKLLSLKSARITCSPTVATIIHNVVLSTSTRLQIDIRKRQAAHVHATTKQGAAICAARQLSNKELYALVIHINTKIIAARQVLTLAQSSNMTMTRRLVRANSLQSTKGVARMEIPHVVILEMTRAVAVMSANATN